MHFYPNNVDEFKEISVCIDKYFFSQREKRDYLSKGSPIITQGSCFAVNFAKALIKEGYPTAHLFVNEWINSTHANAIFFNYINTSADEEYVPVFSNSLFERQVIDFLNNSLEKNHRRDFIEVVRACGIFVLTIGVAPLWFDIHRQQYCLSPEKNHLHNFQMKTTGVEANVNSISFIVSQIRKINPQIEIFLTLSPAPLNATNEYPSIFEADCVSKSTLRLAIDQIVTQNPEISYWPSFEIVRWLGSHLQPVYGSDDNHPRHVSNWLVDKIVAKFVDLNGGSFERNTLNPKLLHEIAQPFQLVRNF